MPYSRLDCVMTAPEQGMVIAVAAFTTEPEKLFHALTDPVEIGRWWGGRRGGSQVTWLGKAEAGGAWAAKGVFPGGRSFKATGLFLDVEPRLRIVQTWHASWDAMTPTEASLRFEAHRSGTVLSLVHTGFDDRLESCEAQAQMWWKVIKWMRPYLQNEALAA